MVRDFQCIIGNETKKQMHRHEGRLPDSLIACDRRRLQRHGPVPSRSSTTRASRSFGVEAAGSGVNTGLHAASITGGRPGILHGNRTYILMDDDGQITEAHSISAGLDYPGIGPEHAWLNDTKRVTYVSATDQEALEAFQLCCQLEGIIPALEPSHALAHAMKLAPTKPKDHLMVICMSGRGDKDIFTVADHLGVKL
jgi:tryptophan synthase beta chain